MQDIDGEFSLSSRKFFLCNKRDSEKNEKQNQSLWGETEGVLDGFYYLFEVGGLITVRECGRQLSRS